MDWLAVGTFIAGLFGGYTIKAAMDIRSNKSSSGAAGASDASVAQSGNIAGGNIAGGDDKINH